MHGQAGSGHDVIPLEPVDARGAPEQASGHGILVVDKPIGKSSFAVVAAVRRASGIRKVGHGGTLDPLASGVLVVCLGAATRVIEEIHSAPKTYDACVRLGESTTTYDTEGEVTGRGEVGAVDRAAIESVLPAFRGSFDQKPPMYSAAHHGGRRLYRLARAGQEVERSPRRVTVHELIVVDWQPPDLRLALRVSSGTYVRSLAHDLGQALGVGGHLAALRRIAVGPFAVSDAWSLDDVVDAFAMGWWPLLVRSLDEALLDYPSIIVGAESEQHILHGRAFVDTWPEACARPHRAYGGDGRFLAIVRWDPVSSTWHPERVFPT